MDYFLTGLGLLATGTGLIRALPQWLRLMRSRQAAGVSVDTAGTSCAVSIGWTTYGVLTAQPFVSLTSGVSVILFGLITLTALRLGRSWREFRVTPVWLAVLVLTGVVFQKTGLGLVLSLSALASNLPQIRVAFRETDLTGLSLGTWVMSLCDGLIWGLYALIQRDPAVLAYGLFQSTTSGLIVFRKATQTAADQQPALN